MAEKFESGNTGSRWFFHHLPAYTDLPFNPRPEPFVVKDRRDIRQFAKRDKYPTS